MTFNAKLQRRRDFLIHPTTFPGHYLLTLLLVPAIWFLSLSSAGATSTNCRKLISPAAAAATPQINRNINLLAQLEFLESC